MALCTCQQTEAQLRTNRDIEIKLTQWRSESLEEKKVLVLGTREAGKSTFMKQMRIIHGQGYTDADRAQFRVLVYHNIFLGMKLLVEAMENLKIPYAASVNKEHAKKISEVDNEEASEITDDLYDSLTSLWADAGVQSCYERRREFQISDSAKYYFDSLGRIHDPNYVPTIDDVLRVRVPTTGIMEYKFRISGEVFRMFDVGGQRTKQQKWIHCFDDVKAVIFLTAINEYDQVSFEDENKNRMSESLALFQSIIYSPWFSNSSIVLFLNKTDLFDKKIAKSHLGDYFPAYTGPKGDPDSAKTFIREMFQSVTENVFSSYLSIFPHFIQATNTENIKRVYMHVQFCIDVQRFNNDVSII